MSAPKKPAPLTPADIRAIRELVKAAHAAGWRYRYVRKIGLHRWHRPGLNYASVDIRSGRLSVFVASDQPVPHSWSDPASSVTFVAAVLADAGLLPAVVSVTDEAHSPKVLAAMVDHLEARLAGLVRQLDDYRLRAGLPVLTATTEGSTR